MVDPGLAKGFFFLTAFLVIVLLLVIVMAARTLAGLKRRGRGRDEEKAQPVEFVIGTFHELVSKLKEKERELETLRSQAEARADRLESYSENILQSVPSGMITFDGAGRVVMVNRAAERILGIRADDCHGQAASVLSPDIAAILEVGETPVGERKELPFVTVDGRRLWLGFFVSRLRDRGGKDLGAVLGFSDLTEIKRLQEKIELRERLTHLGEVSAGIAHEIRNPMAVIAGYAQMLDGRSDLDESARRSVRAIRREIDGINRVIADFLQFARPTQLSMEPVDPAGVLAAALEAASLPEGVRVETDIRPDTPIRADVVLLRQCLINLIQNAVEAMEGRGTLTLRALPEGRWLHLDVSDTGPGIPEEMKERLFLPFVTSKPDGTGLGLAIVQKIAVLHEGAVEADSRDTGTTFRLILPLWEAAGWEPEASTQNSAG